MNENILNFFTEHWHESDMYKFTKKHQGVSVDIWGGWIGKNDGFEVFFRRIACKQ